MEGDPAAALDDDPFLKLLGDIKDADQMTFADSGMKSSRLIGRDDGFSAGCFKATCVRWLRRQRRGTPPETTNPDPNVPVLLGSWGDTTA